MTPAAKPRDPVVAFIPKTELDLAFELAARWRECAEALALVMRADGVHGQGDHPSACVFCAALARFAEMSPPVDAMKGSIPANVLAGVGAEEQRKYDAATSNVRAIADANAAILRLQARLDAVRPVVAAAVSYAHGNGCPCPLCNAVSALPAADREWAQDNQPRERQKESE